MHQSQERAAEDSIEDNAILKTDQVPPIFDRSPLLAWMIKRIYCYNCWKNNFDEIQ